MKEGDLILTPIAQANGQIKNRPALLLRMLPPYQDALLCGISTQLHQQVAGFDELIRRQDGDFVSSGLVTDSLVRLGFLSVIPRQKIFGSIGSISRARHRRLLQNLSDYSVR